MKFKLLLAASWICATACAAAQESTPTVASPSPSVAVDTTTTVSTDTPTVVPTDTPTATSTETSTPLPPFPPFFGGTEDSLVRVNEGGQVAWKFPVPGGAYSVETEGDGSLLVAGGEGGVFLVARRDGDLKIVWDWKTLGFKAGDITSATAADMDPNGRVSLVLAAEPAKSRIFLAEARSNGAKVRWEYQTLIAPRQAGLCADGKHFWVLCSDGAEGGAWSLEEIDFKKNKSDWSFDTYLSALAPIGFIRPPAGWNLLAVPGDSAIAAFLKDNSRVWQSSPLGTNAAQYLPMSLRKDPSGDGFLTSFTAEGTGGATRLAYLSATDGEEVTHLEQWSDKGVLSPLPAFRCLAPGPASTKKAVHPVKKSVPVRKSPGVKGAKSAAPTPRP